ncbi:MAG: translocation/assembly module TamB domain-containing protein [Roseovarius sp.]
MGRVTTSLALCAALALPQLAAPQFAMAQDEAADQAAQEAEDRGYLQGLLEDNLSGAGRDVRIVGFEGALSSQATMEQLTIADDAGVWITLTDLVLDWNRAALLRGRLEINTLSAATIDLPRLPNTDEGVTPEATVATEFALPELPVSVQIGEITAARVSLGAPILGEAVILAVEGSVSLAAGAGEMDLSVLRGDGRGTFSLEASYANDTDILALDLALEEQQGGIIARLLDLPGQPALALSVQGEDPLSDYTAAIALSSDGAERLGGTVAILENETGAQSFSAVLDGDLRPLFEPAFHPFFGGDSALRVAGIYAQDGALDLSEFSLRSAALSLTGRLALGADHWPTSFDLNGALTPPTRGSMSPDVPLRLPGSGPATFIDGARISAAFDAASGNEWRAEIGFDGFAQDALSINSGSLRANGTISRDAPQGISAMIAFNAAGASHDDAAIAKALGTALRGQLQADWASGSPLSISALDVVSGDLRVTGAGTLGALDAGFPASGEVTLRMGDLSRFAAIAGRDLGGAAAAELSGTGAILGGAFDLDLTARTQDLRTDVARLDPLLTGPSDLVATLRRDTEGTVLEQLEISNAALSLNAEGRSDETGGALSLSAKMPDVARAEPRLTGPAEARTALTWAFGGAVNVESLTLEVAESRITASGTVLPDAPGLPAEGQLSAQIADLSRFAALAGQRLAGTLSADLSGSAAVTAGTFDLQTALAGSGLRTGIAKLDKLLTGNVTISANGGRTEDAINIREISMQTGQLALDADAISDTPGAPLDLSFRLADLGLFAPDFSGPVSATGQAQLKGPDGREITLDLNANGPGGTTAALSGAILEFGARMALDVQGAAPLGLANAFITPQSIEGTARYDLRIDGPPALSSLSGVLSMQDARVALPRVGISIEGLTGDINLAGGRAQTQLAGRLQEGGTFNVTGPIALTAPFNADLDVQLTSIRLTDNLIYTSLLDGFASLNGPLAGGAVIGGNITLDETEIRIPSSTAASSVIFENMTHEGAPPAVTQTRQFAGLIAEVTENGAAPFGLNLIINAPRRLFVRGRGLDAELRGQIRLAGTTKNVVPSGFLQLIRGRLDLLGKRLLLTEGLVDMRGALDPYLRFVAETTSNDILVRIVAEGLASEIEIAFESEPDLPQEEIISQLILGRDLASISPLQAAQLASAVATLAGRSENDVLGQLRNSVGLSDLDVATNEDGTTELRAGAYIAENLYSEITADSEGREEINLNLDVTRNVTIRGSVDSEGGNGLGVFFEKDY